MLKHGQVTETVIGVFYDVYNELGHGFLEAVYQKAMYTALLEAGLAVEQQKAIPVWFRGKDVGLFFADLVVNSLVVVEPKVARTLDRVHEAQLLHYLKRLRWKSVCC